MAIWQVDFALVPRRALESARAELRNSDVMDVDWWGDAMLPSKYAARIAQFAEPAKSWADDLQTWGKEDGDRVDVWTDDGSPRQVHVRIDVRKLDAKFAAGLLGFARSASAVLIRDDGWVVEPTVNGLSTAIKSSKAWQSQENPGGFIQSLPNDLDEE